MAAREALQAEAEGPEERSHSPFQELCDRSHRPLVEADGHEVGEARDRVLQPTAVHGTRLEDRISDLPRVLVCEDVVV